MSSRAIRRLKRDQDIIYIPEAITPNGEDDLVDDVDLASDSKPKSKKKQKAVNLFSQVGRLKPKIKKRDVWP